MPLLPVVSIKPGEWSSYHVWSSLYENQTCPLVCAGEGRESGEAAGQPRRRSSSVKRTSRSLSSHFTRTANWAPSHAFTFFFIAACGSESGSATSHFFFCIRSPQKLGPAIFLLFPLLAPDDIGLVLVRYLCGPARFILRYLLSTFAGRPPRPLQEHVQSMHQVFGANVGKSLARSRPHVNSALHPRAPRCLGACFTIFPTCWSNAQGEPRMPA